jgi:hypothetical protein
VADSRQDEGFKVVDRRHFTETGDLREGAAEQERRDEEAAAKAASAQAAAKAKAAPPPTEPGVAAPSAVELVAEPPAETIASSRSFQMLVDFLTRNAAAMMRWQSNKRSRNNAPGSIVGWIILTASV